MSSGARDYNSLYRNWPGQRNTGSDAEGGFLLESAGTVYAAFPASCGFRQPYSTVFALGLKDKSVTALAAGRNGAPIVAGAAMGKSLFLIRGPIERAREMEEYRLP